MSTQELMQPFCAVDDIRVYLGRIFRKDGYLFATNGAVLVSVKDDSSVETDQDIRLPKRPDRQNKGIIYLTS